MFATDVAAFTDLDSFVDIPRVEGLWLSPDGRRVVVGVATPDHVRNRYTTALWEVAPDGALPARRLTRSAEGESGAAFTPGGDLLFVSARPHPLVTGEETGSLWLQPARGGDARLIAAPSGGVRGVVVSETGTVVFGSTTPSSPEAGEARAAAKVSAILHEEFPIRFWDHDLGPERTRLFAAALSGEEAPLGLADLTGHVGRALDDESTWDITPDGRAVVAVWTVAEPGGSQRHTLVAIDVATGERRVLLDDPAHEYHAPRISPDGDQVVVEVERRPTADDPEDRYLGLIPLTGGVIRPLAQDWDRWPRSPRWTPDGEAVVVTADDHGRAPLWRVDVETGAVSRLTGDHGAYTDFRISPDGYWVYALRSAVDSPPAPVRIALDGTSIEALPGPAEALDVGLRLPGRLEEVTTTADDGTPLRAWLALPHEAFADAPSPLLLQIHGGPHMSAKSWHWRWNPWLAVARGYAVLLPDYALSSGYGADFIRRGWERRGDTPFRDLMTITDAVQRRPDIDADRAAANGASYGGYLANWIAGHTGRFAAIVTHASIWDFDTSAATSDLAYFFKQQLCGDGPAKDSPHRSADAITTPMLVVHGERDHRVPIGNALHLWWELSARSKADSSGPHKFLFFPDEGHFIRKPHNVKVFYATMFAFLDHHVHGVPWQRPELLG
ncbi:prolyl oligopeptidase family serine peptidase [Amycolatopsis sp. NPDC059027]|uniref:S9 family peptidase n=1 Tax=Amycolatopsis sp. NPDC059027 TaxID=3346709 RepID=UPI00366E6B9F